MEISRDMRKLTNVSAERGPLWDHFMASLTPQARATVRVGGTGSPNCVLENIATRDVAV